MSFGLASVMIFAGTPPPPPPPGLPIDGGISFLVITGILYGVFKLREKE
jgi:hypothetical protein